MASTAPRRVFERPASLGVIAVLGLAALILGAIAAYGSWHVADDWTKTSGEVVAVHFHEGRGQDGHDDWDTTIRYLDTDGRVHEFVSEHGSEATEAGDEVGVRFDPRIPERAMTSTDRTDRAMPGLVVAVGGLACVAWVIWTGTNLQSRCRKSDDLVVSDVKRFRPDRL